MKRFVSFVALTCLALGASAKDPDCGVQVRNKLDVREYEKLARISPEQARKSAVEAAGSGSEVKRGGLETERGCLVYKYDIQQPGKSGVQEVVVDAGSGAILKSKHEGVMREKAERALDPKGNLQTYK